MKKSLFVILVCGVMFGCSLNNKPTSIDDWSVKVSRVESHKVWIDIFPTEEFQPYYVEVLREEEYAAYGSLDAFLSSLTTMWADIPAEDLSKMFFQGAYLSALGVAPASAYVLILVQVQNNTPVSAREVRFASCEEHTSPFVLTADSISMAGDGTMALHPADTTDTYFWDFALKNELRPLWDSLHSPWFYYDIVYYYKLDFFPSVLARGNVEDNLFRYYNTDEIAAGDTICLLAVGYDESGETSAAYMPFWLIYQGADAPATVLDANPDGYESCFRNSY